MKFWTYGVFIVLYYCARALVVLPQNSDFYISFLDVGQGDSFVINIPDYGKLLIDTGANYQSNYLFARGEVFPVCRIKAVFITHFDSDHRGGLARITRFCQGVVIHDNLSKGDVLQFSDASLTVLSPSAKNSTHEENDDSLVMLWQQANFNALLTGDAGLDILEKLDLEELPPLTVYKVSHHGSKYNTSYQLLNRLKPRYCVISVGKNPFGHPAPEVLNDLARTDCKTFRTDRDGTVMLY